MKLIFLDIDGVMNSSFGKGPYLADMEVLKLELLKKLIDDSGFNGIVLTSDRRLSEPYMKLFIDALDKFEIYLVGQLRRPKELEEDVNDNRGKQIVDYLASCNDDIEQIVILDDDDDGISDYFQNEFIKINRYYGLDENVAKRIMSLLTDSNYNY